MTMSNIGYADEAEYDDRVKMIIQSAVKLNLTKVLAHAPGHIESVLRLSDAVQNRGTLDPIVRQVALVRLCVVTRSLYELTLHESVCKGAGMTDSLIAQAKQGSACADLPEDYRMAAMLAEELAFNTAPKPSTHAYFLTHFTPREYVELVQGIGFYMMQIRIIETFEVECENPPIDLTQGGVEDGESSQQLEAWRNGRL